ncbi:unnamed protein product [Camellia sinensis]
MIKPKSKHIWIDHCSLCDYDDGLIDITRESTDITISSVESQIYSQCNIYKAGQKKVACKYLTEKVESMICGREVNPDLVQVEKAKAILMEHEVAILEVLAKLADVSDGVHEETVVMSTDVSDTVKPLNFDEFSSAAELEVLGMERLKSELQSRGLKCGGTLQERAARLFLLKTTPLEKLPKKLLAKNLCKP